MECKLELLFLKKTCFRIRRRTSKVRSLEEIKPELSVGKSVVNLAREVPLRGFRWWIQVCC
jgi:hypothetical protein